MAARGFKGGTLVFTPGWERLLSAQMVPEMDRIGRDSYQRAKQLAPVDDGYTKFSIAYQVDPEDASLYVNAGAKPGPGEKVFDAQFSEFGAGARGAATGGNATFPSPFGYDTSITGRAAQPFIRPAVLAAVEQFKKRR